MRIIFDAYHALRTLSWLGLTGVFFTVYLALNLFFATVLWLGNAEIANSDGSFPSLFFFSVQTLATIGYGGMSPADLLSNVVVTIESFVGVVYTAVVTGLFFAKFSSPTARVNYSATCVVADIEGVPTLMFRCANARSAALVEATITCTLTRAEVLSDGERVRRLYDLALRRNTSPVFALSWTVMHPVVEGSPLFGRSIQQIKDETTTVLCTMTGIDDSLASTVHSRWSWSWNELEWGRKFADMITSTPSGEAVVDMSKVHDTRPSALTWPW
jgi:inward rectifier potassium channel